MIDDPGLTDRLSDFPLIAFDGTVFRVTRPGADPVAPSVSGGRWAPRAIGAEGVPILYTSLERDGALAEVASYLAALTPVPSKPLRVHRLSTTTSRTLRLVMADLASLGVEEGAYGTRNYAATQRIGAALNFLGFDGLIAPSARWRCDNLMIFTENHGLAERLEAVGFEDVNWRDWAAANGIG